MLDASDLHTEWTLIKVHTAKCDVCEEHNTGIMYRCASCAGQHCAECVNKSLSADHGTSIKAANHIHVYPSQKRKAFVGSRGPTRQEAVVVGNVVAVKEEFSARRNVRGSQVKSTTRVAKRKITKKESDNDDEYDPDSPLAGRQRPPKRAVTSRLATEKDIRGEKANEAGTKLQEALKLGTKTPLKLEPAPIIHECPNKEDTSAEVDLDTPAATAVPSHRVLRSPRFDVDRKNLDQLCQAALVTSPETPRTRTRQQEDPMRELNEWVPNASPIRRATELDEQRLNLEEFSKSNERFKNELNRQKDGPTMPRAFPPEMDPRWRAPHGTDRDPARPVSGTHARPFSTATAQPSAGTQRSPGQACARHNADSSHTYPTTDHCQAPFLGGLPAYSYPPQMAPSVLMPDQPRMNPGYYGYDFGGLHVQPNPMALPSATNPANNPAILADALSMALLHPPRSGYIRSPCLRAHPNHPYDPNCIYMNLQGRPFWTHNTKHGGAGRLRRPSRGSNVGLEDDKSHGEFVSPAEENLEGKKYCKMELFFRRKNPQPADVPDGREDWVMLWSTETFHDRKEFKSMMLTQMVEGVTIAQGGNFEA